MTAIASQLFKDWLTLIIINKNYDKQCVWMVKGGAWTWNFDMGAAYEGGGFLSRVGWDNIIICLLKWNQGGHSFLK